MLKGPNLQEGILLECFILDLLAFEDRRLRCPKASDTTQRHIPAVRIPHPSRCKDLKTRLDRLFTRK